MHEEEIPEDETYGSEAYRETLKLVAAALGRHLEWAAFEDWLATFEDADLKEELIQAYGAGYRTSPEYRAAQDKVDQQSEIPGEWRSDKWLSDY
jgi:hypothetical protein